MTRLCHCLLDLPLFFLSSLLILAFLSFVSLVQPCRRAIIVSLRSLLSSLTPLLLLSLCLLPIYLTLFFPFPRSSIDVVALKSRSLFFPFLSLSTASSFFLASHTLTLWPSQACSIDEFVPELHLPAHNDFIPTDFELCPLPEDAPALPQVIFENDMIKVGRSRG